MCIGKIRRQWLIMVKNGCQWLIMVEEGWWDRPQLKRLTEVEEISLRLTMTNHGQPFIWQCTYVTLIEKCGINIDDCYIHIKFTLTMIDVTLMLLLTLQ